MAHKRFLAGQRKGVNLLCALFASLLTIMWMATVVDKTLDMGWGWDTQILWLAPAMIVFAVVLLFCAMAIFRSVGKP